MKCKIRWIDENGKPTDDENEAICIVWVKAHDEVIHGRIVHLDESERFPCCAKHAEQLNEKGMEHWEVEEITK